MDRAARALSAEQARLLVHRLGRSRRLHSGNQEAVGTNSNCSASGKTSYYAWFELVPYLSYRAFPEIKDEVRPGDRITGLVRVIDPRLVELRLEDRTQGWTFMRKITFTSQDTSTAEWVVEAPAVCVRYLCHEADLAHFDDVTIGSISESAHKVHGTLTNRAGMSTASTRPVEAEGADAAPEPDDRQVEGADQER